MPEHWYKLARPDGFDFHTGHTLNYRAALGSILTCPDYAPTSACGAGIHVSRAPNDCFVGASMPCSAFVVEPVEGLMTIDANKSKAQAVVVVEEITDLDALFGWDYTGLCAHLAAFPDMPWFCPDGQPDSLWHLSTDTSWPAARDAARAAARDAARAAAWDAARAAAWDAAWPAAWAAARDAAWDAAWDAAEDAAEGAARVAARDATEDAAWAALLCVCAGLPLAQEHRTHLTSRWEVWRKGYALLCDVNGTLYAYAATL